MLFRLTFKVTPKGRTVDHDFLSPLAGPFYIMFIIMLVSIPTALYQMATNPYAQDGIIICLVWLFINIVITFSALGVFWERQQVRTYPRAWANSPAGLNDVMGSELGTGCLHDLSMSGVGVVVAPKARLENNTMYELVTYSSTGRRYCLKAELKFQRNVKDGVYCGLAFTEMEANYDELVSLVYGDSQRWLDFWERDVVQPSLFDIAQLFLKMGLYGVSHSVTGMASLLRYYRSILTVGMVAWWRNLSEGISQSVFIAKPNELRKRRPRRKT